jgi:hypothetical protein
MASGRRYTLADFERTVNRGPYPGGPTLAYAKRQLRGAAKGLSRQRARGHRPREHVTRTPRPGSRTHAQLVERVQRHFVAAVGRRAVVLDEAPNTVPVQVLRDMLAAPREQIRTLARLSPTEYWGLVAADLREVPTEYNPYWYQGGSGAYPLRLRAA